VAKVRHLDPLQRQIHAVKRKSYDKDSNSYIEKMTIQTGIDGFRAIANRTGLYMPSDRLPVREDLKGGDFQITVWVKKYHPLSQQWHEFGATGRYSEFVQTRKDGQKEVPVAMWARRPNGQLEKCIEALVLRRGWPEELGQIYIDEEMQQADARSIGPEPGNTGTAVQDKNARTRGKLETMKPSDEPNRGHGNEGMTKTDKTICAECRVTDGHSDDCKYNPKNQPAQSQADATQGKKKSSREAWETAEGWDAKVHISFDQGVTLFKMQKDLQLSEDEVKRRITEKLGVEHRKFIKQDDFYLAKDAIDPEFKLHAAPQADEEDGEEENL
jgi:phage recombination protein Bet